MPSRTVEVAAADLPGYIQGLPRLLTEDLNVAVSAGTIPTAIAINCFYGPGRLTIFAQEGAEVNLNRTSASYNHVMIDFRNLKFQSASESTLMVYQSDLRIMDCDFIGVGENTFGIEAHAMGAIELLNCTFERFGTAIMAAEVSIISAINCTAVENDKGAYVWNGGIVLLAGTTPELVGGVANKKSGGMIVKADGTPL